MRHKSCVLTMLPNSLAGDRNRDSGIGEMMGKGNSVRSSIMCLRSPILGMFNVYE